MYLADYHCHSLCSHDSSTPLVDHAQAAVDAGLGEICLTDHYDLLDPEGGRNPPFHWAPIEAQLALARPRFEGRLLIRMGLELGDAWVEPELGDEITSHPQLDFVIGSAHGLGYSEGGKDLCFLRYDSEELCHRVLRSYFECLEAIAVLDCFDVMGHVIYPLRYMERDGQHISLAPYLPRLEGIFRTLIARDKGIELNTNRGGTVEPWREILALYRDCGGRILTLGSDAHRASCIAGGFPAAAELMRSFGFSLTVYEKRQPQFIPL